MYDESEQTVVACAESDIAEFAFAFVALPDEIVGPRVLMYQVPCASESVDSLKGWTFIVVLLVQATPRSM